MYITGGTFLNLSPKNFLKQVFRGKAQKTAMLNNYCLYVLFSDCVTLFLLGMKQYGNSS